MVSGTRIGFQAALSLSDSNKKSASNGILKAKNQILSIFVCLSKYILYFCTQF